MNKSAAGLFLEMQRRGLAHEVRAIQMHLEHRIPFIGTHFVKQAVAQNAGIVDHAIDTTERVHCRLDDACRTAGVGHAIGIGNRLTTGGDDFIYHLLRRAGTESFPA